MPCEKTNCLKLNKPAKKDLYNVDDFNANFDLIDKTISDIQETMKGLDNQGAVETITESLTTLNGEIENIKNNKVDAKTVDDAMQTVTKALKENETQMQELFQNVDNGKQSIGTAIIDKAITVPAEATFEQLATAIGQIQVGKKFASGQIESPAHGTQKYEVWDLGFVPNNIIFRFKFDKYHGNWGLWSSEMMNVPENTRNQLYNKYFLVMPSVSFDSTSGNGSRGYFEEFVWGNGSNMAGNKLGFKFNIYSTAESILEWIAYE